MNSFEILAVAGLIAVMFALGHIASTRDKVGSPVIAAALSGLFLGFTLVTIQRDGLLPVWTNHTTNLWGVQVWWDLLFSVGIAAFLIVPRAREQGMKVVPWLLFVAATASIGLLAMIARLFWLERRAKVE